MTSHHIIVCFALVNGKLLAIIKKRNILDMVSVALIELADMMMDQYECVTGCYDKYELQNLRDAAKAGLQEFDSVCMQIFGANFDNTLFASVKAAYDELSWNYENNSDPTAKTENDIINELEGYGNCYGTQNRYRFLCRKE